MGYPREGQFFAVATDVSTTLAEVVMVSTLRMTSSDVVEMPVTLLPAILFRSTCTSSWIIRVKDHRYLFKIAEA